MNKTSFLTVAALFILSTAANSGQLTAEKTAASTLLLSVAAFGKGQYASDRLTGIHISYSHMTRYSMKSFLKFVIVSVAKQSGTQYLWIVSGYHSRNDDYIGFLEVPV